MAKILIQFAHPAFGKSKVHKTLVKYSRGLQGVTFNDLYELYPDLHIDVAREKNLLLQHDIIVLQHPFYWYSGPAIIKQWLDLVLEYNWAYGPGGNVLEGKKMMSAISCGGSINAYTQGGYNRYPVTDFLLPFKQTAYLCKMNWLPPFVIHSTYRQKAGGLEALASQYTDILTALVNEQIAPEQYNQATYINDIELAIADAGAVNITEGKTEN
ncbi:NAD(P)H-dependent oxidoreductase [Foetidibacter luteolus]|uniref:NAD(P)H-dependent oxidoreductase n=1 Tax=Foetidibacter luteolus TaxID=2608880 RepID=UPI00129ABA4D|nr:NAD(P)H-dependent oxidoreductase [Foetidibacter luteolus]